METETVLEWLAKTWKWLKKCAKFFVETNFSSLEDLFCTLVLFVGFAVILITFTLSAYNSGYDHGETDGLKKGFESGTRFISSGK